VVGRDITLRKEAEERIRFISLHDPLTNLYNRRFFEQEMASIESLGIAPVALMVCDLDGLKFINDTLGHKTGDDILMMTANLISGCSRPESTVARIGGDEFAILIKNAGLKEAEAVYACIREGIAQYNRLSSNIPIHISVGFAVRNSASVSMSDVFREADNNMYREKLHSERSVHSGVVFSLMQALQERDFITGGHAERMEYLVELLGSRLGLPRKSLHDLRLLARFHDIGKVGVPDAILLKNGPLDGDEVRQMQRHSEIGYRIARVSSELQPIAEWILKHHEWWNGKGYPLQLAGEEIPLECRILAIADAYDAMTSERPYRSALSPAAALEELRRCAEPRFDPQLTEIFIKALQSEAVVSQPTLSKIAE